MDMRELVGRNVKRIGQEKGLTQEELAELSVAIAQGEAQVEPNRVLDHSRRETVSAIRDWKHRSAYGRPAATARLL